MQLDMRQNTSERLHIRHNSPNFTVFSLSPGFASQGNTNYGIAVWPQDVATDEANPQKQYIESLVLLLTGT